MVKFDLNKLSGSAIILIVIMLATSILPGSLFIYIYNKNFFLQADFLKLILLSSSITIPILFVNIIFALQTFPNKDKDLTFSYYLIMGSSFTFTIIFISILTGFFFKFTIQIGVLIVIGVQILWFLLFIIDKFFAKLKRKNKKING